MAGSYGVLVYDIPTSLAALGNRLRKLIRKVSIRVNLSVYMIQWGQKAQIEAMVARAETKSEAKVPNIRILKFDSVSDAEARDMAVQGLRDYINGIAAGLRKKVAKMQKEDMTEMEAWAQASFVKKVKEAEGLAVAFQLMEDVEPALKAVSELVEAQLSLDRVRRMLKKEVARAV